MIFRGVRSFSRARVLAVLSLLLLCLPLPADDGTSVIKIESAQKTEYRKDKDAGSDTIVLTGDVKVSVSRGGTTTRISADRINFNRANDMIFAEGNVTLAQSSGDASGGETVTAESLLFNTATLEGVFDNGRAVQTSSDALNLPSGSTLIVASDVFGRDSGGTIAFKSGNLTFCDDENPHWRILASRIWLLPGGEFAFLNAVLFVGRVPLLWLPAFYYPKDELVFNPSFGHKARTGYFVNTTTYIFGRKTNSSATTDSDDDDKINFFSLMNTSSMKKQVREGLVLHNLDEDFKGDTAHYAKIMADYYANLGFMTGFDMNLVPGTYVTSLAASAEIAFSNTVFKSSSGTYLPYNDAGDKISDSSNFMGFRAPFRFRTNLKMTMAKPFSLTLSMPIYSDPFFVYDFDDRVESMDWIDYAMNGGNSDDDDDDDDVTETSSFSWNLSGSHTFKLPESVSPFISSLSISSFSSSVTYSSKANSKLSERDEYSADKTWATYTPERKFYYPSQVNPFKVTAKVAGTLVKIPASQTQKKSSEAPKLSLPDEFKTEEDRKKEPEAEENEKKAYEDENDDSGGEEKTALPESALPLLSVPSFSTTAVSGLTYSLGYTVTPDFSSQFSYLASEIATPDDFSWSDMQSTYVQIKSPVVLTSALGFRDSFFSMSNSFTFNPVYQKHPYLSGYYYDDDGNMTTSGKSIMTADYKARKLDLTGTNSLTLKPFCYTEHFANTAISWNSTVKMIETKYISEDDEEPEWEYLTMQLWSEDCVTAHTLSATLAATEFDKKLSQSFTLSSTLRPQPDAYKGTLSLSFPFVTFSASGGIKENTSENTGSGEWHYWVKDDLSQSLSVSAFSGKLKFTQSYIYDFEEREHESLKFSLSGYGMQLSYTASYVAGYTFNVVRDANGTITSRKGWKANSSDDKSFQPYQLSLAYTNSSGSFKWMAGRIALAPTLSASIVYDFLRPTSSYMVFKPGVTFKVSEFLDLSFSAESRNSSIFRYFCADDEFDFYYGSNGERSIFRDLVDSLRFDSDEKRKASAFKMKSISVTATHDLDDWDFSFSLSISPKYVSATSSSPAHYDFSPYASFSVSWRPLSSMKTQIVDDYGEWKLNP